MGHYDNLRDRDGTRKYELRKQRKAYERKQDAEALANLTDEQIREFLRRVDRCNENRCTPIHHALEVWYDDEVFEVAEKLVDLGAQDNVYHALDTPREAKMLKEMSIQKGWITLSGAYVTTEEGRRVMNGGEVDRLEIEWNEKRARKYRKHE